MSLSGDIAGLVSESRKLQEYFANYRNEAEVERKAALAAAPDMMKVFWVDQINGDDDNSGNENEPLRSIEKAVKRVPEVGICKVKLLSDYHFSEIVSLNHQGLYIDSVGEQHTLTFQPYSLGDNGQEVRGLRGINMAGRSMVLLNNVKLQVPELTAPYSNMIRRSIASPIRVGYSRDLGMPSLFMSYCDLSLPENIFGNVFAPLAIGTVVLFECTTSDNPYLGKLVSGFTDPAGTEASSISSITTNLEKI
ncbi:hypothetical protein [Pseudovibrio sp. POLY-S9]|uniref:hypothetical protein n=1 Tax=Pseudovibrio sp. POLY-S9 TaxID=1576596 RepID=UPI00070E726B|nr:hypothetical protein [Pseudovibrio sp. POLY-S9]